ncbi:MAG TPA: HlyD family efflux transporter periplasmic adaptor subunit, partial [Puia sp.]|nr:HlyD family efflux transporter periplasmic adaptor subunit [Puia sp.]
ETIVAITPVTIDSVKYGPVTDSLELNASSTYLQNSYVKSIAAGFIQSVQVKPGDFVSNGKTLFTLETKESAAIGETISSLDSSFKFSGLITVQAKGHGYITQLNHQPGDYVQDGEQLAVISDQNSFVFILNMPYEDRNIVLANKTVFLSLPDGTRLTGTIGTVFPNVDSLTQTQGVTIRVSANHSIPQNLIAKVHILRNSKERTQTVARAAVLTNDAQTSFWVMKLIDSTTAVKIPVEKGMEFPDRIEIIDPVFKRSDQILISGNYGLTDTAKVRIVK